ncbi:MAG: AAA family ATPase [Oscillospiraceae bacterium]|nr:AAA family ATPase [Oscillospiraceae bacterium]
MFVVQCLYDIGGQATCKELSREYGEDPGFYNIVSTKLAKRIHRRTGCPLIQKESSENAKWWPILYRGKDAGEENAGVYIWRLRDELKEALELLGQNKINADSPHYWIYAPGRNASMWDEFYEKGIMALGWHEIDDLRQYHSAEEIQNKLQQSNETDKSYPNDTLALWNFVNVMKPGDIVFCKKGSQFIVGCGVVESDYEYDTTRDMYKHIRRVNWTKKGVWNHPGKAVLKTLTEITFYPDYVQKLLKLVGFDELPEFKNDAKIFTEDEIIEFKSDSKIKKWFSPIIEVLLKLNGEARRTEVHEHIVKTYPISDEEMQKKNKSGQSQVLNDIDWARNYLNYEGFLDSNAPDGIWKLADLGKTIMMTEDLAEKIIRKWVIIKAAERKGEPIPTIDLTAFYTKRIKPYTQYDFLHDIYMPAAQYTTLTTLLRNKKNIILQGAPGVGKTYTARRLAWAMMGEKDDSRIEFIQFHQSYSYEDFIMGYRPKEGSGFTLHEGVFYRFCDVARNDPNRDYFFIIDEINRGNLSKIFGELLMLIEADKRGEACAMKPVYSEKPFSVPKNLYIIGMMNTADRSLAMIDYALRRRFSFFEMEPAFGSAWAENSFQSYCDGLQSEIFTRLIDQMRLLNDAIEKDSSLGAGFCIGHSYFCNLTPDTCTEEHLRSIVEYDILPLLREYWFDDKSSLDTWEKNLRGVFHDE